MVLWIFIAKKTFSQKMEEQEKDSMEGEKVIPWDYIMNSGSSFTIDQVIS